MLSVTMWLDKKGNEKGRREFFFSCDNEGDRDKWIIAIEYLKTKAIYDTYAGKNRNVGFNTLQADDTDGMDKDNDRYDKESLLADFGFKLKQRTTLARVMSRPRSRSGVRAARERAATRRATLTSGNAEWALGRVSIRQGATTRHSTTTTRSARGGSQGAPRASMMRRQTSTLIREEEDEEPKITATDLVPKLKLLYGAGVVGFIHHIEQTACKTTHKQLNQELGMLDEKVTYPFYDSVTSVLGDGTSPKSKRGTDALKAFG